MKITLQNKKAIGYVRVSTNEQADKGSSLEAQSAKVAAYAALHDLDLVEIVVESGKSGKNLERVGMKRVLAAVNRREVEVVIVPKLDRMTRSMRDLQDLIDLFAKRGVEFASVAERLDTSTANGRFFVNMLGLMAQWEREQISERTKTSMQLLKAKGRRISRLAAIGKKFVRGRVVDDPKELELVQAVADLRKAGESFREIAASLNERGLQTRGGGQFYASSVARLLAAA